MPKPSLSRVYVHVVELGLGPGHRLGASVSQEMRERVADIETGIVALRDRGPESRLASVGRAVELDAVSASFGVTLMAEAGVIVSKASRGNVRPVARV